MVDLYIFFFKQKTAYEMRISDWSSDVCSSDLSISVTNNEVAAEEQNALRLAALRPGDADWEKWGICDYITKPRIAAAISGERADGGLVAEEYRFGDIFPMKDGLEENRSEEHTSELQSLMRISYAVFCLKK